MRVTFFIPCRGQLESLLELDPDADWKRMDGAQRWLLQTVLRLRAGGIPAEASETAPRDGLVVFHAMRSHASQLLQQASLRRGLVTVAVRADKPSTPVADFEVLQSRLEEDGRRRFAVPHWPQPGLLPRDPARGDRLERVAFMGFDDNLHPEFLHEEWRSWLGQHGMQWVHQSQPFSEGTAIRADWHDYRDVDVLLALRPPGAWNLELKPASKLHNAWRAGVPALLGSEPAFREERKSPLDYIEIGEPADARDALLALSRDPARYRAMVEHGRQRATELTMERIRERWVELLFTRIPHLAQGTGWQLPLGVRVAGRWAASRVR